MHFNSKLLAAASLLTTVLGFPLSARQNATALEAGRAKCASGFHIIAARGSTEPQGEGPLQAVSQAIEAQVPGSDDVPVVYPAELIPYGSSENSGVINMTQLIVNYTAKCPNARIVLLGYSQGGQIISDVLGGASHGDSPPLADKYKKNIAAAVMFADPSHVAGKPYNAGNATNGGIFSKDDTTALDRFSDVLQSFCQDNDFFCDSGSSIRVHLNEVETWQDQAVKFIVGKA